MDPVLYHMTLFYKAEIEALEAKIVRTETRVAALELENERLNYEKNSLSRQYERLEEYADEQEAKANAIHDVVDEMINRSGEGVRRDLLDSFNEVARDLGIDLDIWETETLQSDEVLEEDITGLDEFFN